MHQILKSLQASTKTSTQKQKASGRKRAGRYFCFLRTCSLFLSPITKWMALATRRAGAPAQPAKAETCTKTALRSEEHTSELQSLMRNSYAAFCLKKTKNQ